ncbi:polyphosphate--glucose phosphotransferase [Aeromicrobium piscarium]|uniref:ROK family protein n=1 Tax=Aeromicrobium piscarium TaxID=2590901 RepID=A0A554RNJ2_9ACTN|nr:ROK family protein [Aeromicrobium piscarium]TSD55696.1 ROK family protein [Aeromicrobium piscarium]
MIGFGIDIGGTGTKGAPVDLTSGSLASNRTRFATPKKSTPEALADVAEQIIGSYKGLELPAVTGVAIPAVVQRGVARSAANIDKSWIDTDVDALFTERLGHPVHVVNDADAAGVAEARYGAARGRGGVILVITLGTGIGSALIVDGTLVPNTELGHLELRGDDAEHYAATSARERENLSWTQWAKRLHHYFRHLERLFSPDLFIVGGGVSKNYEAFMPLIDVRTEMIPADLRNNAGIIGAAALAHDEA